MIIKICEQCKKEFKVYDSLKRIKFCSKKCYWETLKNKIPISNSGFKKGAIGKKWKDVGTTNRSGCVRQCKQDFRNSKDNYNKKHRRVVEKKLGRKLTSREVVHHINKKRDDNRIKNLYLFESSSEHMIYHSNRRHNDRVKEITKSNLI